MNAPRTQPFASRLPWWVTRTVATGLGPLPCMVMKDGTLVAALRIRGLDHFCASNATINRTAATLRGALNLLPANGYLQAIFETGFSFKPLLRQYLALDNAAAHPVLREARRRRASMLASTPGLSRTQLTYYIGHRHALGRLASHRAKPSMGLFGSGRRHPTQVTAELVRSAADELAYTVSQVLDALQGAAIHGELLTEWDLLTDCHRALNPLTSRQVPPPFIVETRDDLERLERGRRAIFRGPNLASQLPLGPMDWEASSFTLDDPPRLHRALGVQRYPFATEQDWLFPIQYSYMPSTPLRLVLTHLATDRQMTKEQLEHKRNLVQARLAKETIDHDAVAAYKDYEAILEQISSSDERIFQTSITAIVTGKNYAELDAATREVKKGFAEAGSVATTLVNQQLLPWLSTLPGNGYTARYPYPVLTSNCAHLTPYFQPYEGEGDVDFLFGTRQRSLRSLSWRQTGGRDNTNSFIIGSTGSGKTFYFSHILKTTLALGGHVVVADTKGPVNSTYKPMCELLGGQYIALDAADESVSFNPCPEPHLARRADGGFTDSVDALRDIILMMVVPDIDTHRERDLFARVADDAIAETYRRLGDERTPVLDDILESLTTISPTEARFVGIAKDMATRLRLWCEDRKRGALLNRPTKISSDNPFQVFDFYGLDADPALAAVLISTLSARIFDKMQTLPLSTPKIFGFDEAWAFFDYSQVAANLISALFRVARSYGASCSVASQSYKDVAESRAATALMANASIYALLRHNSQHDQVAETFALSPRQLHLFKALEFRRGEFAEHLFVDKYADTAAVLRYAPTPWELWIDTSAAIDMEVRSLVLQRVGDPVQAFAYLAEHYPRGADATVLRHEQSLGGADRQKESA